MRDGIKETLGKCIKAVIVSESPHSPKWQAFLIFTDDTHYEFYGDQMSWTGGVDPGGIEKVRTYIGKFPERTIRYEYLKPEQESP